MKRTMKAAKAIRAKFGLPTGDVATVRFTKAGGDGLSELLKKMVGRRFDYKDQDGTHFVQLEALSKGNGGVCLQDLKSTSRGVETVGEPYWVDLYNDGTLTYL